MNNNNSQISDNMEISRKSSSSLIDSFDFEEEDFDLIKLFSKKNQRSESSSNDGTENKKKKSFKSRQSHPRKDPKTSVWWTDYVIDEGNKFDDPAKKRDYKLFRYRFVFQLSDVRDIIARLRNPDFTFWEERPDAFNRPGAPLELLVLGSLRILSRIKSTCYFSKIKRNYHQ